VQHECGTTVFQAGLADPGGDHWPFSNCLLESKKIGKSCELKKGNK
jgi:hypothetical protein